MTISFAAGCVHRRKRALLFAESFISFMEESTMRISRRRLLAGSFALAGVLGCGMLDQDLGHDARAVSAPIGQTIWLQATNNNGYVSARTDQTDKPLEAIATQVRAGEAFDVVDAGNGLIALRAHDNSAYVSARFDELIAS